MILYLEEREQTKLCFQIELKISLYSQQQVSINRSKFEIL